LTDILLPLIWLIAIVIAIAGAYIDD
jgi:hypothetical protein